MTSPTVRDVLAEQTSGISRAGLLAWCRLRIDPAMTEAQLEDELARLGDEVESDGGFLRLRRGGQRVAGWSAPAEAPDGPAGPSGVDAGRPFDWQPSALAETAPETQVDGWVAPSSGLSRGARIALLVGGLVAAVVFTAISLALGSAVEQAAVSLAPGAAMIDAFELEVGDCVMWPGDEFEEIETRPCTSPHEAEVFFVGDLGRDGSFPDDDVFDAWVDTSCVPAFATYTGSSFDDQDLLDISWFSPTEESWRQGDREMVCLVTPLDTPTTDRSWRDANP